VQKHPINKRIQQLRFVSEFQTDVLRIDQIHSHYGGNKYYKLKNNIEKANGKPILTFGGAHSNHIYSTAAFCHEHQLKSIGIIRGEESSIAQSPTLQFAIEHGMQLHFVSREKYKNKEILIDEWHPLFGDVYIIPEGGNNEEGVKGCMEILNNVPFYDYVFCACGTGCTYAGILAASPDNQVIIGISVLKGEDELTSEVNKYAAQFSFNPITTYNGGLINKSCILTSYHFGGYAKHTNNLLEFKKIFEKETDLMLDYIYTSKLFYAVFDLLKNKLIPPGKKILIIHSGGQQGNHAYEKRYGINT